jgi:hypothetical protein
LYSKIMFGEKKTSLLIFSQTEMRKLKNLRSVTCEEQNKII